MPSQPGLSDLEKQVFQIGALLTGEASSAGNLVEVFSHGSDVYEALGAAIDQAQHHVHAEFYLIRNDKTGEWFRDKLVRAAERGVEVRLLCDAYGCLAIGAAWRRPLRKAGARVGIFLPMRSLLLQPVEPPQPPQDRGRRRHGRLLRRRQHRRRVPRADDQASGNGATPISASKGPAARALQRVFLQDWFFATGEGVDPTPYFPSPVPVPGDATVAIVPSGPDTRTEAIHRIFFAAIAAARERVWITTPVFRSRCADGGRAPGRGDARGRCEADPAEPLQPPRDLPRRAQLLRASCSKRACKFTSTSPA